LERELQQVGKSQKIWSAIMRIILWIVLSIICLACKNPTTTESTTKEVEGGPEAKYGSVGYGGQEVPVATCKIGGPSDRYAQDINHTSTCKAGAASVALTADEIRQFLNFTQAYVFSDGQNDARRLEAKHTSAMRKDFAARAGAVLENLCIKKLAIPNLKRDQITVTWPQVKYTIKSNGREVARDSYISCSTYKAIDLDMFLVR